MQPYIPTYSNYMFPAQPSNLRRATYPSEEEIYGVPSNGEFDSVVEDYLSRLSLKKRDKALIDQERYNMIREVLKNPKDTSVSTAQFRFWVKKMFTFFGGSQDVIYHDGKPVATKEDIYSILVAAHREANHGGRDKTSAIVKYQFSWIPKELIARFVRCCPTCKIRRNGCNFSGSDSPSPPPIHFNYEAIYGTATSAAATAVANSKLYTTSNTPAILAGITTIPGMDSIESSPSPREYDLRPYYMENFTSRPLFTGIFNDSPSSSTDQSKSVYESYYDYTKDTERQESSTYLDDMLSTYKLSVGPQMLNPNDILESIMSGWTEQEDEKDVLSHNSQEQIQL